MRLSKEEYAKKQTKKNMIVVRCELKILSIRITTRQAWRWSHDSYPRDRMFNPHLTAIKDSYNKDTYENV